jgi:preprotein translocase subunit SecD
MTELIKNYKIILLLAFMMVSFLIIGINGIDFGIDFKGGTLFQIEFDEPILDLEERARITTTISQRLDWTGLRDTSVNFFGEEFVIAQVAETDPATVERIESLLMKQGRFEVTIDGQTVFTGEGIIDIIKDPTKGYSLQQQEENSVLWTLPFILKSDAAERFKDLSWHKCELTGYEQGTGRQYECDQTYFYIDRPKETMLVVSRETYETDRLLLIEGNRNENIPVETEIDDILLNSTMPHIIADDESFSEEQIVELTTLLQSNHSVIVSPDLPESFRQELDSIGFEVIEPAFEAALPFVWQATGLKQIISLSADVTNQDVPDEAKDTTEPISNLLIRGFAPTLEEAQERRSDLSILLESGSLPVGVKSISKETISPLLGENFLINAGLIGLVALLVVALVIFLRYRVLKLTVPIVFIGLCEVFITVALASLISKFDLGAVAGILAAVGTGVDDQIIITDELMKGGEGGEGSLVTRVKRAFFMVIAAAATTLVVMLPIIVIGFGLGKLVGFAITTSVGVIVGVLITRPAFAEITKEILSKY